MHAHPAELVIPRPRTCYGSDGDNANTSGRVVRGAESVSESMTARRMVTQRQSKYHRTRSCKRPLRCIALGAERGQRIAEHAPVGYAPNQSFRRILWNFEAQPAENIESLVARHQLRRVPSRYGASKKPSRCCATMIAARHRLR